MECCVLQDCTKSTLGWNGERVALIDLAVFLAEVGIT